MISIPLSVDKWNEENAKIYAVLSKARAVLAKAEASRSGKPKRLNPELCPACIDEQHERCANDTICECACRAK